MWIKCLGNYPNRSRFQIALYRVLSSGYVKQEISGKEF